MFCRQDVDMGPNNIQPFAPEFRKFTAPAILHGRSSQRHCAYAFKQCANALFYSPPLNAKEFIQILLRASYSHVPEHYSTTNFAVRPAARNKTTLESGRTLASNAAMRFFSNLLFQAFTLVSACTFASIAAVVFLASYF